MSRRCRTMPRRIPMTWTSRFCSPLQPDRSTRSSRCSPLQTEVARRIAIICALAALLVAATTPVAAGQDATGADREAGAGISLTPAIVTLTGHDGQAHRQTLQI